MANNRTIALALNKIRALHRNGKGVELKLMHNNCITRGPCALCGALAIPRHGLILALCLPETYGSNPVCDSCAEKHDPHLFILCVLGREASDAGRDYDFDCEALASVAKYQKAQNRISLGLPPYIAWQYEHVGKECVRVWEDAAAEYFGLPKPARRPWWLVTASKMEPEPDPPREQSALEIECICSWEVAGASITVAA